ncbi:DUF6498-containing protein [soil metagenome]
MPRIAHLLFALAVIAVPAVGWFAADWSGATTLAVYWFETLAGCLFIAARVILHRRWAPCRGHFRYEAPATDRRVSPRGEFLTGFAVTSLAFCAAHAVLLGAVFFVLRRTGNGEITQIGWRSVAFGCVSVSLFLALEFGVDLFTLRRWSFRQIELLTQRGLSRIVVVHVTLVAGFIGIAMTGAPDALFGIFVVLKSLAALSAAAPQWEPTNAPRMLSRAMNKIPNVRNGGSFEDTWAQDRADESARRTKNEQPAHR